jgi:hypothetical protein
MMSDNIHNTGYLRERAARLRSVAPTCDVISGAKMLELAVELEAKAAALDQKLRGLDLMRA